jgi:non-ribosomal peptide synthetase component F
MVEHGSVVNIIFSLFNHYPFSQGDVYLFKTPVLFDVSVSEIFGWFIGGGRLVILEDGGEKDVERIIRVIKQQCVSHINFVPSLFAAFLEVLDPRVIEELSVLKYIFLAGEALLPPPVHRFRELGSRIILENLYGPTEGTVYASKYSLADWQGEGSIPIGEPLGNVTLYILDHYNHLQPLGVPGELFIGGDGLARGYLNNPELTAGRFILAHSSWLIADRREKKSSSSGELPMSYQLSAMSCLYKGGW